MRETLQGRGSRSIPWWAGPIAFLLSACGDTVTISNGSGQPVGLLVDGQDSGGRVDDRAFTSPASPIAVGALTAASQSNEVIGFTNDRPPKQLNTPWTDANDNFALAFAPTIRIPVTVWIVKGPFDQQRQHAIEACIRTSAIWRSERMGVDVASFEIQDATANPKAPDHFAFPDGDLGDSVWKPLRDDIGFVAGRLNIYWVDTVNGGTGTGWSNFGAQVAMGRATGDELLSHETGHSFSLTHTDGNADFNDENVMWSASNVRQYLTEGQLVRAHLNPSSSLNALYHARPGEVARNCNFGDSGPTCPLIQKRIWADGSFPPN